MALIPSGIEPATFRLVAQFFNQLRHRVHPLFIQAVNTFPAFKILGAGQI